MADPRRKDIPCPACGVEAGKMCISIAAGKPLSDMHRDRRLISCNQAAKLGVKRLRKPIWSHPLDHVKIDIIEGDLGPWMHMFSPFNESFNGRDPIDILWITMPDWANPDAEELAVYDGPHPDTDEYQAQVMKIDA